MGFQENCRHALDGLKATTQSNILDAYRNIFDTLSTSSFDWDFGSIKFISMEKDLANKLRPEASSHFRSMILEQAKEAGCSEAKATWYWNAVYSGLESPLPPVVYVNQERVQAARPVFRENRSKDISQSITSRKSLLLSVVTGSAMLGLLTVLITRKPLIMIAGIFLGAVVGGAVHLVTHKRKTYISASVPHAPTGDMGKLQSLCKERAEEMVVNFDEWYEKALRIALTIWSKQDDFAE